MIGGVYCTRHDPFKMAGQQTPPSWVGVSSTVLGKAASHSYSGGSRCRAACENRAVCVLIFLIARPSRWRMAFEYFWCPVTSCTAGPAAAATEPQPASAGHDQPRPTAAVPKQAALCRVTAFSTRWLLVLHYSLNRKYFLLFHDAPKKKTVR